MFRRVYQHYGSPDGYEILPDARDFLNWVSSASSAPTGKKYSLGILTNAPIRTVETILPLKGIHEQFDWFLSCQDIGKEKPGT
jgi:FMN phosphatase YigB (HAD superfamily)